MLQFKGGTDVALLNAMMHTIVEEGLTNQNYIDGFTEGFDDLKDHIRDFPPEKMADICGIDAETIRHIARLYARAQKSIIFWGMGISQHVHGTDNARCLISLALMTGHIGRPGTGLHPLRGQNNVQGASDVGLIPMVYPDYQSVANPEIRSKFETYWQSELDPDPGLTVVEIMKAILAGEIRAMYIMGENPAMSDPDVQHAREALASLDHLVVQDLFLTETAWHADVVLPASAFPEKDGTFTNTNRQVQLGRRAVPLPGDARQDLWIIQEIARRIGLDWNYSGPADVFAEMAGCMPSFDGITWDRLCAESSVTYPVGEDGVSQEVIFGSGFPTASGRGRFVPADVLPPDEVPDEDYPMILTTGRVLEHWHTGSMTRRSEVLDRIEPEASANLSPRELRKRRLNAGDMIRVETRRGAIELRARADRDVPEGVVFIPFCYVEAAANLLTNAALDPFGKIPEFKFCAARIAAAKSVAAE
jgi:formate dehydrogenase major subunit